MSAVVAGPKAAIGKAGQTCCIRALWSGTPWTQSQKYPVGLARGESCRVCQEPLDKPGHRFHVCPG
eukprot:8219268-Pyramimonas_sp.AAC.1